jgi:hypothetical protein
MFLAYLVGFIKEKDIFKIFKHQKRNLREIFQVKFPFEKNISGNITTITEPQDYNWSFKAKMFKYNIMNKVVKVTFLNFV